MNNQSAAASQALSAEVRNPSIVTEHGTGSGGIRNATIVTEHRTVPGGIVLWQDGRITYAGPHEGVPAGLRQAAGQALDGSGGLVIPGFIDMHVHGGCGHDFMDADPEGYKAIAAFHARHGTTGLLATTVTAAPEALLRVLEAAEARQRADRLAQTPTGAELYGVHLEGPFISPKWPGAQNPAFIAPPTAAWLEDWSQRFPGLIRMMTLAPEQPGALDVIAWLHANGIIAAAGHTDATYADIQTAAGRGLSHAVHTFNAMRGLHHREPGTVGAVLTDPRLCAEVIADGLHVSPPCIQLLTRLKTQHNLVLITDAISAAGLGDGDYSLGGLDVVVKDGAARLKKGGALAGSTLTMIEAFRFMVREIGLPAQDASALASGNPARRLGLYDSVGSVTEGKLADLLLLDAGLNLHQVWKRGQKLL
ncbi:N-acetylglucosamine-6-phosphate deacetylase [Paenibacillus chartarius]|uniref:N-acetylglucosamine-6-phosphate deacetylase n=1 Tax=Paenibacillus chartarius TaxID=747481 RepID=A0ABV6DLC2_9BACL